MGNSFVLKAATESFAVSARSAVNKNETAENAKSAEGNGQSLVGHLYKNLCGPCVLGG